MFRSRKIIIALLACVFMVLLWPAGAALAQAQQPAKDTMIILDNDYAEFIQQGDVRVHKLLHHVKLRHGSDTLYCDSAFFYIDQNSIEAFGDARIFQADGTMAFADYMRYTGNNKTAYMRGNASVFSGNDNLWSEELEYNLNTKIGKYRNGGTLQTRTTLVTSEQAVYNTQTKDAQFTGNVIVDDADYKAGSEALGYNTNTEVVTFLAPSIIVNDQSVLHTSGGTYDAKNKIAHFTERPNIQDNAYYIEGDFIDYNKASGQAKARGNVIAIDTANKRTLYAAFVDYNEISDVFWAYGAPIMKLLNGADSFYIRAEYFFAEPEANLAKAPLTAQDSLQQTLEELNRAAASGAFADSSMLSDRIADTADTAAIILSDEWNDSLIGNNTLMMSDDLPGFTDSAMAIDAVLPENHVDTLMSREADTDSPQTPWQVSSSDTSGQQTPWWVSSPTTSGSTDSNTILLQTDTAVADTPVNLVPYHPMLDTSLYYIKKPQQTDTSKPRYFIAYHHVLIYSDSLQGRCDSLSYTQTDSLMRMFYNPVLWSGQRQISGDTVIATMDSSQIEQVYLPRNGIMISRSGPEQADMYDQIQGNKMWAYFTHNNIDSVTAYPNAATIYFATDDKDAYVGVSEVNSEKVAVIFDTVAGSADQEIKKIIYYKGIDSKMTPMKDADPPKFRLSRFKWQVEKRPQSLEAFMNESYPFDEKTIPGTGVDTTETMLPASDTTSAMQQDTDSTLAPATPVTEPQERDEEYVPSFEEILQQTRQKAAEADTLKQE